jgi:tetratricopeptide (TPR) repeat protein
VAAAYICRSLVSSLCAQQRFEEAEPYARKSAAILEGTGKPVALASAYATMAYLFLRQRNYEQLVAYAKNHLAKLDKLPANTPGMQFTLSHYECLLCYYAHALEAQGKMSEAAEIYVRRLKLARQMYKQNHTSLVSAYNGAGWGYLCLSDYQEALKYLMEAERLSNLSSRDETSRGHVFNNLGDVYLGLGDITKAQHYIQAALTIRQRQEPLDVSDLAESHLSLGNLLRAQKDYRRAQLEMEESIKLYQQVKPLERLSLERAEVKYAALLAEMANEQQRDLIQNLTS